MKMPENFVKSLKDSMAQDNIAEKDRPEIIVNVPELKPTVDPLFLDYVEAVGKFRIRLLHEGCPLCQSQIDTKKSKFWFIIWDQWKCTGEDCQYSKTFNCVFDTYWQFREEPDGV